MKLGIIIIFHDSEDLIDKHFFISHFNQTKKIKFCFVNNASSDNTYQYLKEIKEDCSSLSLVDIKKYTTQSIAVKAGARFLFNAFELNHIGYVSANSRNKDQFNLNELLKAINANKDFILEYDIKMIEREKIKKSIMNRIFSVMEYLKELKPTKQLFIVQSLF
jgi:hypothetical protein